MLVLVTRASFFFLLFRYFCVVGAPFLFSVLGGGATHFFCYLQVGFTRAMVINANRVANEESIALRAYSYRASVFVSVRGLVAAQGVGYCNE